MSIEAERHLASGWLSDWEWTGQSYTPYDFRKQLDDGSLIYADSKCSSHPENLQVSTKWIDERIEKYGLHEMSVIAVYWNPTARAGVRDFTALGWVSVERLKRQGFKQEAKRSRYRKAPHFTYMHAADLQPMRTLPC